MSTDSKVTIDGVSFETFKDACAFYKISPSSVRKRMKKGMSLEEALKNPKTRNTFTGITVDGKVYSTLKEAALYYNVPYSKVFSRVRSGWSLEQALGLEEKNPTLKVRGLNFGNLNKACEYYNIPRSKVDMRLARGWTLEQALGVEYRGRKRDRSFYLEGRFFKTIVDACKYYGLSERLVRSRLHIGWSYEEAFGLIVRDNTKKSVVVEGRTFISLTEACKCYSSDFDLVNSRMLFGWSVEEALDLIPRMDNGIILKKSWNSRQCLNVKIEKYLGDDYYKCIDTGKKRYYSKEELINMFKEKFNGKK